MSFRHFYSEREQALFESLNFGYLMDIIDIPPSVYDIVARDCFIKNLTGKSVDSLRRCLGACQVCNPYRMTDEFDNLIEID